MSMIQFVANYDDLSTDRGYQFRFHCDKCGNGFLSEFDASIIGTAGGLLRAASDLFGGWAGSASNSAYDIQRAVGGKAHDSALEKAILEGKRHFKQCGRCGKWVCPEVCWNEPAGQCDGCAPKFEQEIASAHAHAKAEAARQQMYDKAAKTDYVSGIEMKAGTVMGAQGGAAPVKQAFCAECGAKVGQVKFCPECGSPVKPKPVACPGCGFEPPNPAKFCPECGSKMA